MPEILSCVLGGEKQQAVVVVCFHPSSRVYSVTTDIRESYQLQSFSSTARSHHYTSGKFSNFLIPDGVINFLSDPVRDGVL